MWGCIPKGRLLRSTKIMHFQMYDFSQMFMIVDYLLEPSQQNLHTRNCLFSVTLIHHLLSCFENNTLTGSHYVRTHCPLRDKIGEYQGANLRQLQNAKFVIHCDNCIQWFQHSREGFTDNKKHWVCSTPLTVCLYNVYSLVKDLCMIHSVTPHCQKVFLYNNIYIWQ